MDARRAWPAACGVAIGVVAFWLGWSPAPARALIPPTLLIPPVVQPPPPVVIIPPPILPPPGGSPGGPGPSGGPTGGGPTGGGGHAPEPASLLSGLLGAAGVGLAALARRRKAARKA
jgi:hypothetical protein